MEKGEHIFYNNEDSSDCEVKGTINKYDVSFYMDTGADANYISFSKLKHLKLSHLVIYHNKNKYKHNK